MKLLLISFAALIFAPAFLHAQTKLPRTYLFKKESSKFGRFYHIEPAESKEAANGTKTLRVLAASIMPGLDSGGLIFISVQKEPKLNNQTDKTALITYDSKQLKDLSFEDIGGDEPDESILKTESAALAISLKDMMEIIKTDSVTVRFGAVVYRLDKDNIAAFHYLAEQIEKDSKPVRKRKPQAKAHKRKIRLPAKNTQ